MNKQHLLVIFNNAKKHYPLYKNARLLAIHFNGFSHSLIIDYGDKNTPINQLTYSGYTWAGDSELAKEVLSTIPHYTYQNNPEELVYILPSDR